MAERLAGQGPHEPPDACATPALQRHDDQWDRAHAPAPPRATSGGDGADDAAGSTDAAAHISALDGRGDARPKLQQPGSGDVTPPPSPSPAPPPPAPPPPSPPPPAPRVPPRAPAAAAAAPSLLSLDALSLSRALAAAADPSRAAAACRALARVASASDEGFALEWLFSGGAPLGPPGCVGTRVVCWRAMRGKSVPELVRWLTLARRRARAAARAAAAGAAPTAAAHAWQAGGAGAAARRREEEELRRREEEEAREEEDAQLLLRRGRDAAALMLLAGPYSQHLLLPLAARCGDLGLVKALAESPDVPARPVLLEGDPSTRHLVAATAARAAMRAGRPAAAAWLVERLLAVAEESDVDRTDPACRADPFGLLRFCCRHGTAACLAASPPLRRAALTAVARGVPGILLRQLAMAAAGRADGAGVEIARALVEALPPAARPGLVWHMLPFGCRGGYAPMQAMMVRLAERHGLMSCLPGQMAQSTASVREVLAAAMACDPPVSDEPLVQYIRAALQTVLGQPLVEAGQGDSVETAEELWSAARARALQPQVCARLQLPPSVPARVWLERRRLEGVAAAGARGGGGGGGGGAQGGGPAAMAAAGGGGALARWIGALRAGGGAAASGAEPPPDPPLSHLLECLEGVHGAAALDAAKRMLASARGRGGAEGAPGAPGAGGGGGGARDTWLVLREQDALPTPAAVAEAAAVGQAIVAAAEGDVGRIEALRARRRALLCRGRGRGGGGAADDEGSGGEREGGGAEARARRRARRPSGEREGWQRDLWEPHRWSADGGASPGRSTSSGGSSGGEDCGGGECGFDGGADSFDTAAAFPEPGDLGFDKMLVAAAKHGHARVLRALLPPLVRRKGVAELKARGALLMAAALQRRQRDLVRVLRAHGLAARAADGYRLLQTRPPGGGRRGGGDAAAVGAGATNDTSTTTNKSNKGSGKHQDHSSGGDSDSEVAEDAALALVLLEGAEPGGRDERLLNSWLTAAAANPEGGARLCGRRCAAVLRAAAGAAELPVGARVAAPRGLLQVAVLPTADLDVLEAVFAWLERAELVDDA